ncbi:MAG: hypothetical protein EOO10_17295, partial [Chitinophagaceae bacterium]
VGSAGGFGTKKSEKETYYTFTSYVYPPTIFKYDIASGKSAVYKKSGVAFAISSRNGFAKPSPKPRYFKLSFRYSKFFPFMTELFFVVIISFELFW